VQILVEAVEKAPKKRWKDRYFQELSVDTSTARRQFKKRFGMTFVEYACARRMGLAVKQIRAGDPVIEAQLSSDYESGSVFRDTFSRIMECLRRSSGMIKFLRHHGSIRCLVQYYLLQMNRLFIF
jgi:AraC family transcriptional regulator of adaptative response/methylated-DNA-[protein]-cysteine methyltransferase